MAEAAITPISLIEKYFERPLRIKDISYWNEVSEDQWIDFSKFYLTEMKLNFAKAHLENVTLDQHKVRLYFEPSMARDFEYEISTRFKTTPLFGVSPHPAAVNKVDESYISGILEPLKKHLLMADSLYIRDNFYYCFDAVADSVDKSSWRSNPNIESLVRSSVNSIRRWLPILAGIRRLVTTRAIVFMPYYITPSFPYASGSPYMNEQIKRIHLPSDPRVKPAEASHGFDLSFGWSEPPVLSPSTNPRAPRWSSEETLYAWLNARLMNLDPVFPSRPMWEYASGIYFRGELAVPDVMSDLMSVNILPLGRERGLSLKDILSLRKNEEIFHIARRTLTDCKRHIEDNVSENATNEFVTSICRQYIHDHLDAEDKGSVLTFLDNNIVGSTGFALAIGLAFLIANPIVGAIAPAFLTPKMVIEVNKRLNKNKRTAAYLQALF